jgi:hypothetical protein
MKKSVSVAAKLGGARSGLIGRLKGLQPSSKASPKTSPAPQWVNVDYPRPSDKVSKGHYAVRVHAPWANEAQVSLNGTSWSACRSDVGFFWYDWHPERSGIQKIYARARNGAGAWTKAETRECEVE